MSWHDTKIRPPLALIHSDHTTQRTKKQRIERRKKQRIAKMPSSLDDGHNYFDDCLRLVATGFGFHFDTFQGALDGFDIELWVEMAGRLERPITWHKALEVIAEASQECLYPLRDEVVTSTVAGSEKTGQQVCDALSAALATALIKPSPMGFVSDKDEAETSNKETTGKDILSADYFDEKESPTQPLPPSPPPLKRSYNDPEGLIATTTPKRRKQ
jgi:hypothetical protein